jgi:lipoprotein-anchoring transpeptidase ErfK/SrfK
MGKIAKANHVTPELLAEINGIRNVNLIRAGQTIKVIKGPFRAVVDSRTYTLGVYLQNTFVKQFKVGLGADQSTPTGEWRVGTKLVNPTYYPPRSGQVIAADDPANPLGERWIALHGVSGEAAGQLRYGIHGTVEPDSIGKSVSLGCIRLYNEDVEALYNYLVEKESTVIVR